MTLRLRDALPRRFRRLLPLAVAAAIVAPLGSVVSAAPERTLADFLAPPGSSYPRPAQFAADLAEGFDRRLPLDSVVHVLDNGARACRVLHAESTWVVDYTWVYPHTVLPKRWYDAVDLLRVGDSLGLGDDANVVFTFGTYRLGVRAGSVGQVREEARRLRPAVMPRRLPGRLRLKLERAEEVLKRGAPESPADR